MVMDSTQGLDADSRRFALSGEHPGRSRNPVIKVVDIAWLEFERPDLAAAESFARAFGFHTAQRGPDELQLRGTGGGGPTVSDWPISPVQPADRCRTRSAACR